MPDIHAFLSALRELHPDLRIWGRRGGCFRVYLTIKQVFPGAEPWYDGNHVITKIGEHWFDILGEVQPVSEVGPYLRMDPLIFNRAYHWEQPWLTAEQAMRGDER